MSDALTAALERQELPASMERLITAVELADLLCVDLGDLYRDAREGVIPCIRWGRKVRFRYSDVLEALRLRQGIDLQTPAATPAGRRRP